MRSVPCWLFLFLVGFVCLFVFTAVDLIAQGPATEGVPLAETTPDQAATPTEQSSTEAAEPEAQALKLHEIEAAARSAIYLTLMPKKQGTCFLISTDPPLAVTAAHDVARYQGHHEVWIRQNETGYEAQVKKVHVHPAYKEVSDEGFSADVALLELEQFQHDLGQPLPLKKPEDCQDLRAQNIVTLGFPFYAAFTKEEKRSPEAVIRDGVVSRLCDYDFQSTRSSIHERPMMELTARTFEGDSGNPVLDRLGAVVGVVHGRRKLKLSENDVIIEQQNIAVAIHIRSVWELLELAYPEVAKRLKQE